MGVRLQPRIRIGFRHDAAQNLSWYLDPANPVKYWQNDDVNLPAWQGYAFTEQIFKERIMVLRLRGDKFPADLTGEQVQATSGSRVANANLECVTVFAWLVLGQFTSAEPIGMYEMLRPEGRPRPQRGDAADDEEQAD